jgi:hypothetical protein
VRGIDLADSIPRLRGLVASATVYACSRCGLTGRAGVSSGLANWWSRDFVAASGTHGWTLRGKPRGFRRWPLAARHESALGGH